MRTIIAGSRNITGADAARVLSVLDAIHAQEFFVPNRLIDPQQWTITTVISGCARGVDTLGAEWARGRGIPVEEYPADWKAHGRAAGPIRNRAMAERAEAAIVVRYAESAGSEDMARVARSKGLRLVEVIL